MKPNSLKRLAIEPTVIPTIARVFERLIYEQLHCNLDNCNLVCKQQSGFRPLHSTVTVLLHLTNDCCVNIDKKRNVNEVIFLELKEAFATVHHEILLKKLEYVGFDDTAIAFFHSYLSNLKQQCNFNRASSDLLDISRGVPQGTILFPLLFLTYINQFPNCMESCTARLHSDGTRLTISGVQRQDIEGLINTGLSHVMTWLIMNKLSLNILKFEFLIIGTRQKIASSEGTIDLSVNGISLYTVEHTKCLGVHTDGNPTWDERVNNLTKTVVRNISGLQKISSALTLDNRLTVYRSIVEPYYNYIPLVWQSIGDILQKLQTLKSS